MSRHTSLVKSEKESVFYLLCTSGSEPVVLTMDAVVHLSPPLLSEGLRFVAAEPVAARRVCSRTNALLLPKIHERLVEPAVKSAAEESAVAVKVDRAPQSADCQLGSIGEARAHELDGLFL